MKNLIALALAGLLAVSTAASVPPAVSESLPSNFVVSDSASQAPAVSTSSDESALSNPEIPPVSESADESASSEPLPGSDSVPAESETEPPTDSSAPTESAEPEDVAVPADSSEPLDPAEESVGAEETQEAPQQSEPARFSEELCRDLADEQAGSLMGHYGLERSTACTTIAATLALADYEVSDNLDRNYAMVWAALQSALEALAAEGHTAAHCTYQDGAIVVYC